MVLLLIGLRADVPFPLVFGFLGFLAGVTFSGVLGIVEGRHRFDQLSLPRFAAWGGIGGLLLSGIFVPVSGLGEATFLVLGPVFALSSASCAAGSLALARMAEQRELDASANVNETGLTEDEVRDLLGDGHSE